MDWNCCSVGGRSHLGHVDCEFRVGVHMTVAFLPLQKPCLASMLCLEFALASDTWKVEYQLK